MLIFILINYYLYSLQVEKSTGGAEQDAKSLKDKKQTKAEKFEESDSDVCKSSLLAF